MVINNTISKGTHSDNDPNLQPQETARESINGRILSNSDGNWSWQTAKGNLLLFSLKVGYKPIGFIEFTDKVMIHSTPDTSAEGGIGEFGVLDYEDETYKSLYVHADLKYTTRHPINNEGFGTKETDNIERGYWTDNFNPPRTANLSQFVPLSTANAWTIGTRYLVVSEFIVYNSVTYYPGTTFIYVDGMRFGSGTIVEYMEVNKMNFQPELTKFPIVDFQKAIVGNLLSGCYFISIKYGLNEGYETPFLFITNSIPVYNKKAGNDVDTYQNTVGSPNEMTNMGLRFSIKNIDENFDYIKIVAFHSANWDNELSGFVSKKLDIISETIEFDLADHVSAGSIGVSDVLLNPVPIDLIRSMTFIKNRSGIGNIKERSELNIGQSVSATLKSEIYELLSDELDTRGVKEFGEPVALAGINPLPTRGVYNGTGIVAKQWYKVTQGSIQYPMSPYVITYNEGDVFQGIPSYSDYITQQSYNVRAIIRIKKYFDNTTNEIIYDDYFLEDWCDYKSPLIHNKMAGYWDDIYRIGVMFFDKKGYPFFVRFLGDIQMPRRNETSFDGNNFNGRTLQSAVIQGHYNTTPQYGQEQRATTARILSLIVNDLDLTDVIDQIGAFAIVRAPRVRQSTMEGIQFGTVRVSNNVSCLSTYNFDGLNRQKKLYLLFSPEKSISWRDISKSNVIEFQRSLNAEWEFNNGFRSFNTLVSENAKLYKNRTTANIITPGTNNRIVKSWDLTTASDVTNYPKVNFDEKNQELAYSHKIDGIPGTKATLYLTDKEEDDLVLPQTGFGEYTDHNGSFTIVKVKNATDDPYQGSSNDSLQNTVYMFTGHYQEVTEEFKNAIKSGNNYIVNSIQVFGGDCFVSLYSFMCNMKPFNGLSLDRTFHIFLQSSVNQALVHGRRVANVRTGNWTQSFPYNLNGIVYDRWDGVIQPDKWQDHKYNLGYSTEHYLFSFLYPNLPASFPNVSRHDKKIRYSEVKYIGSATDVFRRYLVDNEIDLGLTMGSLVAIRSKRDRMYYWQNNIIGYIPVGERAMKTDEVGFPIQLGVGGIFERSDDLLARFGCQHQQSIIETENGFAWVDFERTAILNMSYDLGLTESSIILGMNNILKSLSKTIKNFHSLIYNGGIASGYNPETKEVYITFSAGQTSRTLIINTAGNFFAGETNAIPKAYISLRSRLLVNNGVNEKMYVDGSGLHGNYFEAQQEQKLSVILNDHPGVKKSFEYASLLGGMNFFDRVIYESNYDESTGQFLITKEEAIDSNYQYLNGMWDFSFPLTPNDITHRGNIMKITFVKNNLSSKLVKFIKLTTFIKQLI